MKKSIIAASAASLAVAALPIAGVFAATSNSFTDTLTVGVKGGCTIEESATGATAGTYKDRQFEATIPVGTEKELTAKSSSEYSGGFSVSCNTTTGTWTISVAATNGGDLKDGDNAISPLGASATMGGNTSSWAIKSNANGATTNPYANYKGFVAGSFLEGSAGETVTFNPSYKAYVAPNQAPGDYTGTVTYTIAVD